MRLCFLMVPVLLLSGCGSDDPPMAPVSGRILVDGQPVAKLRVSFSPVGSKDNPYAGEGSVGTTDEEGRYTLRSLHGKRGAVVGLCQVRISTNPNPPPDKPNQPVRRLPSRFNDQTKLTFQVPPQGTESADFNVSWK